MSSQKIYPVILPAFGAAIIAALAQLTLPIGTVPITLQTFAIGLVAAVFKPKEATLAACLYLLLGAIGLPVFAGGSGGFQALLGPNAGYLLAYPFFACLTSYFIHVNSPVWRNFLAFFLGDFIVFLFGIISLHFLGKFDWQTAFSVGVLPFIIPDLVKGLIVALLAKPIFNALKNESYFK
ncbi:biotin transporter BioY [Streptococcus dentiloxodontae]